MLICYDAAITSLFLIMWPLRGELKCYRFLRRLRRLMTLILTNPTPLRPQSIADIKETCKIISSES